MRPRRAALLLLAAVLAFALEIATSGGSIAGAARGGVGGPEQAGSGAHDGPAGAGDPARLDGAAAGSFVAEAAPPDSGLALFAGAFKPFVADALWARMLAYYEADAYDDMLPVAQAILALDPHFEHAWWITASTIAIDLAAFEDDPAVRWSWRRQGFLVLRDGIARNRGSWYLWFQLGALAELTEADAPLAERFRLDRDVDPGAAGPLELARRAYAEAARVSGHPEKVELGVRRVGPPAQPLAPAPRK